MRSRPSRSARGRERGPASSITAALLADESPGARRVARRGCPSETDDHHLREPAQRRRDPEERAVDRVDDLPEPAHAPLAGAARLETLRAAGEELLEHREQAELPEIAVIEVADDPLDHGAGEELVRAVLVRLLPRIREVLAREVEQRVAQRLHDDAPPSRHEKTIDARHHVVDDEVMDDALGEEDVEAAVVELQQLG